MLGTRAFIDLPIKDQSCIVLNQREGGFGLWVPELNCRLGNFGNRGRLGR